jgi:hypothetical protein
VRPVAAALIVLAAAGLGCQAGTLAATDTVGPTSIDGPVAWYPLDGRSPLGQDHSGHAADALPFKLTAFDDPERGRAVHVNGGGLLMPPVLSRDFTVAFWLRTSQVGPDQPGWIEGPRLFDADIPGRELDFGVGVALDRLAFGVGNPDAPTTAEDNLAMRSEHAVVDGTWHHVAVTRDATTGMRRIYLDGALDSQAVALPGTLRLPTFAGVGWVTGNSPASPPLEADLTQLVLYDRVLDEAGVAALAAPH